MDNTFIGESFFVTYNSVRWVKSRKAFLWSAVTKFTPRSLWIRMHILVLFIRLISYIVQAIRTALKKMCWLKCVVWCWISIKTCIKKAITNWVILVNSLLPETNHAISFQRNICLIFEITNFCTFFNSCYKLWFIF